MHTIAEMFGLTGKVAVVTGGSMGIGRAIALRLAEAGAHVALVDIDADAAERTRCEIQDAGGVAMCVFADASVAADAEKAIRAVVAELGDVHILVNNAGVYPISAALDLTEEVWDRTLDTNLKGAMFFSQAAARNMIEAGHGGKIINMASIEALHPGNGLAHYGASKAGVVMLTKALGKEFAPYGIQVNAIAPGIIAGTPGAIANSPLAKMDPCEAEQHLKDFAARIPARRTGEADDIAKVALVLAGSASDYMVGSVVTVDGGVLLI